MLPLSLSTAATLAACFALVAGPSFAAPRAQALDCFHHAGVPCPRGGYDVASATIDDRLLVIGGFTGPNILATRRLDTYDPSTGSWRALADLPTPVTHAPAVVVGREVWVLGGFVGDHPGVITDEVWRYEVDQDRWSPGPALPEPVAAGAAAVLGSTVHYFGGLEADRDSGSVEHYAFDVAAQDDGWVRLADLPEPRNHLSGVAWQGFLWAIGGQQGHDTSPTDTAFVHVYDPTHNTWVEGPPLPFARSHAEAATFATPGRIVMVGGRTRALALGTLNDVTTFEVGASAWRALAPIPHPISGAAASTIQGELLVTAGNDDVPAEFVDVHLRPLAPPVAPTFRTNCGGGAFVGQEAWCADLGSDVGATLQAPASVDVLGTDEDERFRAQRLGGPVVAPNRLRYRLASEPGAVRVRLHFAELWHTAPGQRVFDVVLQGTRNEAALDLVAEVGPGRALVRTYDVEAPFGLVDVELVGLVDQPILAGIELEALGAGHIGHTCAGQVSAAGVTLSLALEGSTSLGADHATLTGSAVPVGALAGSFGILFRSEGLQQSPTPFGAICVGPALYRVEIVAALPDGLHFPLDLGVNGPSAPPLLPGTRWHFQCWYRDGVGFGLSDALSLTFTP